MAGIGKVVYNAIFKRTSTLILTVLATSFFFERAIDYGSDALFNNINKGKLWDDIKHKYEK